MISLELDSIISTPRVDVVCIIFTPDILGSQALGWVVLRVGCDASSEQWNKHTEDAEDCLSSAR